MVPTAEAARRVSNSNYCGSSSSNRNSSNSYLSSLLFKANKSYNLTLVASHEGRDKAMYAFKVLLVKTFESNPRSSSKPAYLRMSDRIWDVDC